MNQIIIMAAGKGTRMKSELTKVLVPIKGRPMLNYLLSTIAETEPKLRPIVIVSPDNKNVIAEAIKDYDVQYVIQEKQLGTGHAVACAKDYVDPAATSIFVLNGDHPFYTKETLRGLPLKHQGVLSMVTIAVPDFDGWHHNFYHLGRVVRDEHDNVSRIVEFRDADDQERLVREINLNCFCFDKDWLFSHIDSLNNENQQGEYYITGLVKMAFNEGEIVKSFSIPPQEGMGINSLEELQIAESLMD